MARQLQISSEDIQRAQQLRDQATTVADYRKTLSVILVAELSLDADQIADLLGTSRRTVFRDRGSIRNQDDTPKNSWGGHRHCSMTIEEEREFLAQWEAKTTVGGVLTVPPIHAALVRKFRYEYAAVSPWDGCLDFMTSEKMNTDSMSHFLLQVSEAY